MRSIRLGAWFAGLCLIASSSAAAPVEGAAALDPGPVRGWHGPERRQRWAPQEPALHPDHPSFCYRLSGRRWGACMGAEIVLFGHDGPELTAGLVWQGRFDVYNFRPDWPTPWELTRAQTGLDVWLSSRALSTSLSASLPGRHRVYLVLGWTHESDHAANVDAFFGPWSEEVAPVVSWEVVSRADLNGTMSSFEHVHTRLSWLAATEDDRLRVHAVPRFRAYLPPIAGWKVQRRMGVSVGAELRASVRIHGHGRAFVGVFGDLTTYTRGPEHIRFTSGLTDESRRHLMVEAGLDLWSPGGSVLSPTVFIERYHGRGIDWHIDYGTVGGFGLRVQL